MALRSVDSIVTVVVNNFNYGTYVRDAVDSALSQSYDRVEVVVVDDGSTDDSREQLSGYGDSIIRVFKENGGQGSAFNAGSRASHGEVIVFLDADDMLLPEAVANLVPSFEDPDVVKVHWPMSVVEQQGCPTGLRIPDGTLPEGDFRESIRYRGPTTLLSPPTSGNAWSRRFLKQIPPLDEDLYRISADKYLQELAPFYGKLAKIDAPQSFYRVHDRNSQCRTSVDERLCEELRFYDNYAARLAEFCHSEGVEVDLAVWRENSWWHRQERALKDIASLPHPNDPLILVDEGAWGLGTVVGREKLEFPTPKDDEDAVRQLERTCAEGGRALVFVWSTFWWFNHYAGFNRYLRSHFTCLADNERIVAFDVRSPVCGYA